MCSIKIISTVFLLVIISGTVITSGCTDIQKSSTGDQNQIKFETIPAEQLNTEDELMFMKDILSEIKNQGKDISSPLETYRIARGQAKEKDFEGFKSSVSLFYQQCNTIMLKEPGIENIKTDINL